MNKVNNKVRPDNIVTYKDIDLKLGIKSSLKEVKSTLALAILLWECANCPAELIYSQQYEENKIVITDELSRRVEKYLIEKCKINPKDVNSLIEKINENPLFKSQAEPLMVAFELVWKLAKVNFLDDNRPASSERSGGIRYPKKLEYTINADIIHSVIENNRDAYLRVLLRWIGIEVNVSDSEKNKDNRCEFLLLNLLTVLSEGAVFKMTDGNKDIVFNQNSLYSKLIETQRAVDINGDKEAKGSLRILKSLLAKEMNTYLDGSANGSITVKEERLEDLKEYQQRVDTFLRLSATKVIGMEDLESQNESIEQKNSEENRVQDATNTLLSGVSESGQQVREEKVPYEVEHEIKGINKMYFGAPGTGKSFSIKNFIYDEFKKDSTYQSEEWRKVFLDDKRDNPNVFRTTLHPEFTYNDFVGQLQPKKNGTSITYDFVPKIFTQALTAAIRHPKSPIFLILEELSRANVAAVFGDIFQLLDRSTDGSSEYSIDNDSILQGIENIYQSYVIEGTEDEREVYLGYEDRGKKIFIPRNLFIIGTVNTSDQNVFVMDTAFKRRFEFDYIDANDVVYDEYKDGQGVKGKEKNNFNIKLEGISSEIRELEINWIDLYRKLNSFITAKEDKGLGLSEDKQLGQFFLKFEEDTDDNKKVNDAQLYGKLLQYLWEDIKLASYSDKQLFDIDLDTFSQAYRRMKDGKNVFHQDFMNYTPNFK